MNFNQHVHVLDADGTLLPLRRFVPLPAVPEVLLREGFRQGVMDSFFARERMLGLQHSETCLRAIHDLHFYQGATVEMKEKR
jgi:hypothetical protein